MAVRRLRRRVPVHARESRAAIVSSWRPGRPRWAAARRHGIHSTLRRDWVYEIRGRCPCRRLAEIRRAPRVAWRPGVAGPFFVVEGPSPEVAVREARAFVPQGVTCPAAVSVLLPVRDAAATLPGLPGLAAAADARDLEVVAVDDGSRDGSAAARAARPRTTRACGSSRAGARARGGAQPGGARRPRRARWRAWTPTTWPTRSGSRVQARGLDADPALDMLGSPGRASSAGVAQAGMRAYVEWSTAARPTRPSAAICSWNRRSCTPA